MTDDGILPDVPAETARELTLLPWQFVMMFAAAPLRAVPGPTVAQTVQAHIPAIGPRVR
ncbi:hypothetical protein [Niveispirillum sp.]|uniref:hypothetical protein n=1 Tax=Niveispirillum sp. TaxID=1917217 RepID=UPI001B68BF19|nr:hypothetical protein [Niveispirillum sp.]MBP7338962.1 hypothetical protein [Niveispirillum sp.]